MGAIAFSALTLESGLISSRMRKKRLNMNCEIRMRDRWRDREWRERERDRNMERLTDVTGHVRSIIFSSHASMVLLFFHSVHILKITCLFLNVQM